MTALRTEDLPRICALGLVTVAGADAIARSRAWSHPVAGLLDEIAHLGTGVMVLAAWRRPSQPGFAEGLLASSVLLDVDHVPDVFGVHLLRPRQMRPRTHSIATLLALACSPRLDGALVGAAAHLSRDLATGPNSVPLLWPFYKRPFTLPYAAYAAGLGALAWMALR